MKLLIPPEVSQITETLNRAGFDAYLVGGCVRDLILDHPPAGGPKDWDITTDAKPEEIVALFPKTFYENVFGTVTVVNEGVDQPALKQVEITPFRLESKYSDQRHPDRVIWGSKLEDDLKRRDFTINALAYSLKDKKIIDLYTGLKDIKDRKLRAVGNPEERFNEDPLRMLRAIRFAAQLNFAIEQGTAEAIASQAPLLKKISPERIRDEFIKIILSPNPLVGLILAQKLLLLKQFIPELEEGLHVKQTKEHRYDVWEHTLRALQHAADRNFSLDVRLGALFHDIAKPRTKGWNEEKRDNTFYGHEVIGARLAKEILTRLRFPVKTVENVRNLVRNHMFFSDIDKISLSAVRRIITRVGREHIWELMEVRAADRIGMGRPKETPYRLRKYQSMIEEALRAPTSVTMLKINGQEVIHETGLPPGVKIGQILHALLNETLDDPDLNQSDYLIKRAKELALLPDETLLNLGQAGKEKREEAEEAELRKIRSRYRVK